MPRIRDAMEQRLDRQPIWRRNEDRLKRIPRATRDELNNLLADRFPRYENRNFGSGVLAGAAQAGIADILEDVVGVPFGAETEMVGIDNTASYQGSDGVMYSLNVNAPTQTMAEARAIIEAGTGYTTYVTDLSKVTSVDLVRTRVLRDTYAIDVFVED
jgi:hypothetical protein